MAHTQLTLAQRYKISAYLQARISRRRIAQLLDVHPSTIYREVKRNSQNGKYHAEQAQRIVRDRRTQASKARKITLQNWALVESLLRREFSPEQIAGLLPRIGVWTIRHEWIYQHILKDKASGGILWRHLRWSWKRRRKRYGKQDRRGTIPDRVSIEERPPIVDDKVRVGDWEIDTATGKGRKGVLVVAVERKSLFTLMDTSPRKTADQVAQTVIRMLMPFRNQVKTITVDNGKEFTFHQQIATALEAQVYFAHPYSAWERGANENTIGLIRQYFPKNMSLKNLDPFRVQFVQNRLNIRPRKTRGFQSPYQIFFNAVAFGT